MKVYFLWIDRKNLMIEFLPYFFSQSQASTPLVTNHTLLFDISTAARGLRCYHRNVIQTVCPETTHLCNTHRPRDTNICAVLGLCRSVCWKQLVIIYHGSDCYGRGVGLIYSLTLSLSPSLTLHLIIVPCLEVSFSFLPEILRSFCITL